MNERQIEIENGRFVLMKGDERHILGEQLAATIDGDADILLGFGELEEERTRRRKMATGLEELGLEDEAAAILVIKLDAASCPDEVLAHLNRALTTTKCGAVKALANWALTPRL